jgi:hypothetical protein
MPHETLGTNPALASQQNATIDNLALIDMFPHKNGFMRSVVVAIPSSKPRQPAWAAATTLPARSHNNTGRQSAVITTETTPG